MFILLIIKYLLAPLCNFHNIANITVQRLTYLDQYNQIIDGTNNVLRFASRSGVKRFLFTSSGAVYGPQTCGSTGFDEASSFIPDTSNPANVYGVSKRIAEHLCALYADAYGIEVMIARCFAFVGEDLPLNAHFAIGNFIRDALFKPQIIVNGNGEDVRSYLYQSDLADWLWKILIFAKSGAIYNVGSDSSINIASLASLVRNILSPEKEIVFNSAPSNNGGRRVYIPNIKRIKNDLSIKINFDLEEAVKLTVKNYKKNNCV